MTFTFKKERSEMVDRDGVGVGFCIHEMGSLYYLPTVEKENVDQCNATYDIQTWHKILGHCNHDDVEKLQHVQ